MTVNERGLELCGGEKQRLAITQNLLKYPQFVVLDKATLALDTVMGNEVQVALNCKGIAPPST